MWRKDMGDTEVGEKVEMAGWGVEEAQERHQEEASLCPLHNDAL